MPSTTDDLFASPTHTAGASPIRVGIGGWTFAPWRKNFYPEGLVQRRELEYASRYLRAIEINGTFYRAQTPAVYAKWAAETPEGFVFSLKAPKTITEGRKLAESVSGAKRFIHGGLAEFGARLGPILWQLPPARAFDRDDLDAFLDALPPPLDGRAFRHLLGVRAESFLCEASLELARAQNVATVFTDSTVYPSLADITGDFVYARLMRSQSDIATGYTSNALDEWARRASLWAQGGDPSELPHVGEPVAKAKARDVFVFFISSAKERNPAAAMAMQARVDAA